MKTSRELLWIAALLVLVAVQWSPVIMTGSAFCLRDMFFFYMPLFAEVGRQMALGVFPAWNPNLACGAPLAADPNSSALSPDILLVPLLGSGPEAVNVFILFRLCLLVVAAYAALRSMSLTPGPAFLGACVVSLSGPVATTLNSFPAHLGGAIYFLPLAAAGWATRESEASTPAAAAAILIGLAILAGSPELALQGILVFVVCALGRPWWRGFRRAAGACAVGMCIAAPLLIPAARLLPRTPRGQGAMLAKPPGFLSTHPSRLLEFVFPRLAGDPLSENPERFWGADLFDGSAPYILSISVGIVSLVLLPLAVRRPIGRRLAAAAALFLILSLGKHLPGGELFLSLPVVRALRYPEKWLIGVTLILAALAAVACDEIRSRPPPFARVSRKLAQWGASVCALIVAAGALAPGILARLLRASGVIANEFPQTGDPAVVRALLLESGVALCIFSAIFLLFRSERVARAGLLLPALLAVAVMERAPRAIGAARVIPLEVWRDPGPGVEILRRLAAGGRLFYDREATNRLDLLRPFTGTLFGLSYAGNSDIDQFSDVRSRAFAEALHRASFADPRKIDLLRLAGVSVISTPDLFAAYSPVLQPLGSAGPDGRRLYRLMRPGPAARLFHRAVSVASPAEALLRLADPVFPVNSTVVVERAAPAGMAGDDGSNSGDRLWVTAPRPDTILAETSSDRASFLMFSTTFDPNWRIEVDGVAVEACAADSVFLGVYLPPGRHAVVARYSDPSFVLGGVVSLCALVGALLVVRRSRPRAGSPAERHGDQP